MRHVQSLLAAALIASAALVAAQEPICNPCVDGPEMFEHRRALESRVAKPIILVEPVSLAQYEAARRAMATSMMRAVDERCDIEELQSSRPGMWYCGTEQRFRFFQATSMFGDRYKTGLACDEQSVTQDSRSYADDMLDMERCIAIAYDEKTKRHRIDLEASP